jgi:hypothetical protein
MKTTYFAELTDTYGGEANYSWVTRFKLQARTDRGAIQKLAREIGLHFRKAWDSGDCARYDSRSGATCLFLSAWDENCENYSRIHDLT